MHLLLYVAGALVLNLSLAGGVDCTSPDERSTFKTTRFKDVLKALNYLHECLPEETPLEEKCKRYAALISMTSSTRVPYERTVKQLAVQDLAPFSEHYQKIDSKALGSLFMGVIDKYRTSELAPPFVDIIQCLQVIDLPVVKQYLSNPELHLTLKLYQEVLESPNTEIDLDGIDFTSFHPAFETALRHLFEHRFDRVTGQPIHCRGRRKRPRTMSSGTASSPERQLEEERELKFLTTSRRTRHRQRHIYQQRERDRLMQRRLRLLNPEKLRARERVRKRKGREREKMQRERYRLQRAPWEQRMHAPAWTADTEMPFGPRPIYMAQVPEGQRRQLFVSQCKLNEQRQLQLRLEQQHYLKRHKLQLDKIDKIQRRYIKAELLERQQKRLRELCRQEEIHRQKEREKRERRQKQISTLAEVQKQYEEYHLAQQRERQRRFRERNASLLKLKERERQRMRRYRQRAESSGESDQGHYAPESPAAADDQTSPDQVMHDQQQPGDDEQQQKQPAADDEVDQTLLFDPNTSWLMWSEQMQLPAHSSHVRPQLIEHNGASTSALPARGSLESAAVGDDVAFVGSKDPIETHTAARNGTGELIGSHYMAEAGADEDAPSGSVRPDRGENLDTYSDVSASASRFEDIDAILHEFLDEEPDTRWLGTD